MDGTDIIKEEIRRLQRKLDCYEPEAPEHAPLADAIRRLQACLHDSPKAFPYYVVNHKTGFIVAGFDAAADANRFRENQLHTDYVTFPIEAIKGLS